MKTKQPEEHDKIQVGTGKIRNLPIHQLDFKPLPRPATFLIHLAITV
jgi:hypothetical protein